MLKIFSPENYIIFVPIMIIIIMPIMLFDSLKQAITSHNIFFEQTKEYVSQKSQYENINISELSKNVSSKDDFIYLEATDKKYRYTLGYKTIMFRSGVREHISDEKFKPSTITREIILSTDYFELANKEDQ